MLIPTLTLTLLTPTLGLTSPSMGVLPEGPTLT